MSTAARKARKRAGIRFTKAQKVASPKFESEARRRKTWRRLDKPKPAHRVPARVFVPLMAIVACLAALGAFGIYEAFKTGLAK